MSKTDRDQRLAAKLRENLRRRKMQARVRAASAAQERGDDNDEDTAHDGETTNGQAPDDPASNR